MLTLLPSLTAATDARPLRPPPLFLSHSYLAAVLLLLPLVFWLWRPVALLVTRACSRGAAHRKAANVLFPYGVYDSIGRRPYMEDRFIAAGELRGDPRASFYAVFDGHGGHAAAEFCVQRMVPLLANDPAFPLQPVKAMHNAFLRTDEEVRGGLVVLPLADGTYDWGETRRFSLEYSSRWRMGKILVYFYGGLSRVPSAGHATRRSAASSNYRGGNSCTV